ncbi:hypothetical protein Tco_0834622 [Tanacetum coccineum]
MIKRIAEKHQVVLELLEEEYQTRVILAKSKRYFKKGSQRFSSAKATVDTQCHKCGRNGHFARDSKYNKVKAKLALLSLGALTSSSILVKNKGLIAETYEWDKEDVSPDDNKVMEVKCLMALAEEERVFVSKECVRNREWVQISIRKRIKIGVGQLTEDPSSSELKDLVFIKSLVNNTKASILVAVVDSSETEYDSAEESSVCSTFFLPLEKPGDVEPVFGPKNVKTNLKLISTFKTKALKGIIPNEPSSALA